MRSDQIRLGAVMACAVVTLAVTPGSGQSVTLEPTKDNTLYESAAGNLSNGSGTGFFVGRTNQIPADGPLRRALLAFDVAGNVPAGAVITSASLQLRQSQGTSFANDISIFRVLVDWGEAGSVSAGGGGGMGGAAQTGDATWTSNFFGSSLWASTGGDFDPVARATTTVADVGFYTWASTPGLVADVQAWLDTPAGNFGWILIGEEGLAGRAKRFATREVGDPASRPLLTIDYVMPGGPGACCFGDGSCQSLDEANCDSMMGDYQGPGVSCLPNPCPPPVPAASTWGTIVMSLLVVCAGTLVFRRNAMPSLN